LVLLKHKITAPPVQDEGRLVVPPAFTPMMFGGGLGLRCNGRSRPSYDCAVFARPCEGDAPEWETGVDFSAMPAALHLPATL